MDKASAVSGVTISIKPEEVVKFFQDNRLILERTMISIAENTETGYDVYLTEEDGHPYFVVCKGDEEPEYQEGVTSEEKCEEVARKCYGQYLFPVEVAEGEPDEDAEDGAQKIGDAIYEREDQLRLAMADFLSEVLREGRDGSDIMELYGEDFVDEVLDSVLDTLALECGLTEIYRPMFITNEDAGVEEYVEFPYSDEQ